MKRIEELGISPWPWTAIENCDSDSDGWNFWIDPERESEEEDDEEV